MDNQSLSHVRWKCQYHIVFIPKYRKKILYGRLRNDVREIISILCKYKDVQIIDGAVCEDHIHLSVAIPPKLSISSFMGYLKGKSTLMIYDRHPELQSKWDKSFWARGYYVSTIGKKKQSENISRSNQKSQEKKQTEVLLYRGPVTTLAIPAFQARMQTALFRANNKLPLEVVVANYDVVPIRFYSNGTQISSNISYIYHLAYQVAHPF